MTHAETVLQPEEWKARARQQETQTRIDLVKGLLKAKESAIRAGAPASEVLHRFDPLPQLLKNVRFAGGKPLEHEKVQGVIAAAEAEHEHGADRGEERGHPGRT